MFNINLDLITKDPRITHIKNANESYNSNIPSDFNTLKNLLPNLGYYIKSKENFQLNIEADALDYTNLSDQELILISEKIKKEIERRKNTVINLPIEIENDETEFDDQDRKINSNFGKDYIKTKWDNIPNEFRELWAKLGWTKGLWDSNQDPENENANLLFADLDENNKNVVKELGFKENEWNLIINNSIAIKKYNGNLNYEKIYFKNIDIDCPNTLSRYLRFKEGLTYGRYSFNIPKKISEQEVFNIRDYHLVKFINNIKVFKSLKKAILFDSVIDEVNLSENKMLEFLSCGRTNIKKLDLSKNYQLKELYCMCNSNLEEIYLGDLDVNKIKNFNSTECPNLKFIYVTNNQEIPDHWEVDPELKMVTQIKKLEIPEIVDRRNIDEKSYNWIKNNHGYTFGPFYGLYDNKEYHLSKFNEKSNQKDLFEELYSENLKPFVTKDFFDRKNKNLFRTKNNNILSYEQIVGLSWLKTEQNDVYDNFYSTYFYDAEYGNYDYLVDNYKLKFTENKAQTTIFNHKIGINYIMKNNIDFYDEEIINLSTTNLKINQNTSIPNTTVYKYGKNLFPISRLENLTVFTHMNFMNHEIEMRNFEKEIRLTNKWTNYPKMFKPLIKENINNEHNNIYIFTQRFK